jgi:hypothetical protein
VIETALAMVKEPQCRALQVGTLIQLAVVPELESEHVAAVVLLAT